MSYLLDTEIQHLMHTAASDGVRLPKMKRYSVIIMLGIGFFAARLAYKYVPEFMSLSGQMQAAIGFALLLELGIVLLCILDIKTPQAITLDTAGFTIGSMFTKSRYEWSACSPFTVMQSGVNYSYHGKPQSFSALFYRCKPRQAEALLNHGEPAPLN